MLVIEIDNRDGNRWDISGIVSSLSYKTTRIGKASTVELTFVQGGTYQTIDFKVGTGDVLQIRDENRGVFIGFVFAIESGRDEQVKLTAYDQLRYLQANESYVRTGVTATEIIQRIADDFQLVTGHLDDTAYKIPKLYCDNEKLMDIIGRVLSLTLESTGKNYVLYDDFGELTLRNVEDLKLDISIGDVSLAYDYKLKQSIDKSYNHIKLYKDNKETGKREIYIYKDSDTINKWGLLQMYESVDEKMNEAQITERLEQMIAIHNREKRTFSVSAIGDSRVRAGVYVSVNIAELGVDAYFLVNECTHKFEGDDHTMSLELGGVLLDGFVGFD